MVSICNYRQIDIYDFEVFALSWTKEKQLDQNHQDQVHVQLFLAVQDSSIGDLVSQ